MFDKNLTISILLSSVALVGCDEKTVNLGPVTENRISTGESAKAALKEEEDIRGRVTRLEEELAGWIEKGLKANETGNISTHLTTSKDSADCTLQIESDGVLSSWDYNKHIKKLGEDYQSCPNLILVAEKLAIPANQTLSTYGRNLHIFADVVDLDGTISTSPPKARANQNGARGGDLNIYTLSLRTGPEPRLITSGSDAGPVKYSPANLSQKKINQVRGQLQERGITFNKERRKITRVPVDSPSNEQIAGAYRQIEDEASEYIQTLHPDFNGQAPNPFPGRRRSVSVGGKKYSWRVIKIEIAVTPTANKNFVLQIPLQNLEQVKTPGQAGSLRIYSAENQNALGALTKEQKEGRVPLQEPSQVPAWDYASLDAPLSIKYSDREKYIFQLYEANSSQPVKTWTVDVASASKTIRLKPKIAFVSDSGEESARSSAAAQSDISKLETTLQPKAVNFLEAGIKRTGLESIELSNGLKNLSDWTKEWIDLTQRASRLKIKLER